MIRLNLVFRAVFSFVFLSTAALAAPAVFPFIQKNCSGCHNAKVKSGDIDFTSLKTAASFDVDRDIWERTEAKLSRGEMPPPGLPKPPAADVAAVRKFLLDEFARQDRTAPPDPGRVTARRLNRTEYDNTVRDLLGVDIRPAENFPNDESAFGFDNIADALTLSPVLTEKYLHAAERVVRTALFGPERLKPAMMHYPAPVRINDTVDKPTIPKDLFNYDFSGLSTVHSMHVVHRFPVDGEYSLRVVLNGHRPNQSMPARPAIWLDGKMIKEFEVDATDLEGQIVEVRLPVSAGEHLVQAAYLKNYHGLPPAYKGPEPSTRPPEALITTRGKLSEKDIETLRKFGTKIKTDRLETRIDNRFESLDVGGPFTQPTGASAESLKRVFVCPQKTDACAAAIVNRFAGRAFRRPLAPGETAPYLKLYRLARQQGDSFEEGVATALQAVLFSPHFLFRIERDRPANGGHAPVSSVELASRLSYFLWSSMPDDALMAQAVSGRLAQPAVLATEVRRMLRDPRSRALVENFAGQWLQLKNIDVVKPDQQKFPIFDDGLRRSMRLETETFLADLMQNDHSVLDLLDAKHTFLDERMARFYGVAGVEGPAFRRVDMSGTPRGGGLLGQASILTISSYSTRTSPVLRGKWILENLLDAPPPPPPPAVPGLDETKVGEAASLRQQMEAHRKNPACASCHSRMDPLGFGLENLNAIGAWRDKDGKFDIDPAGALPDGRTFAGPQELKKLLMDSRENFTRGLTSKLLTYALGRGLERYDKPVVNRITQRVASQQYRFSGLVLDIVNSLPFRERRPATAPAKSAVGVKSE